MARVESIPTDTAEILRGAIVSVRYTSPPDRSPFTVATIEYDGGKIANVRGNDILKLGDRVRLWGAWVNDPQWGRQFDFRSMEYDMDLDLEGVKAWLSSSPDFHGVGPATASKLLKPFADVASFADSIKEGSDALSSATGINASLAETVVSAWNKNRENNQAKTWLMKHGLTFNQTTHLVNKYGGSVIAIMETNPYQIIGQVRRFGFKVVDEIAVKIGIKNTDPVRIRAGIKHAVSEAANSNGHTCISREKLLVIARGLLSIDDPCAEEMILEQLVEITMPSEDWAPNVETDRSLLIFNSVDGEEHITSTIFWKSETETLEFFKRGHKMKNPAGASIQNQLPKNHTLNHGQYRAFLTVAESRVVCMTGGAGVGKTYALASIADAFEKAGCLVTLCAPTGKAAKRMEEATGRQASTMHRLLEYNGEGFRRADPLPGGLVVIDEVSMVDNWLASNFLRYVDLNTTTLLLVGDPNQLPPVGAGHLLRDMIQQELCPIARLDECMRQAGPLKENCNRILAGRYEGQSLGNKNEKSPWKVFTAREAEAVRRFVLNIVEKGVQQWGYDPLVDVQVITPQHKGAVGTLELNKALQRLIQWEIHGITIPSVPEGKRPPIYEGDKIMCIRNIYGSINLMNGTQCIVKRIEREARSMTLETDDGRQLRLPGKREPDGSKWSLSDFDLAYACTIHKYQGSDAPCVILVVHKSHKFMHTQNLVYTGATRAKETLVTVGDRWGMENAARSVDKARRNTVLYYIAELDNGRPE